MLVDSDCDVDNNDYSSTTNDESSSRSNDDDNDSDSDSHNDNDSDNGFDSIDIYDKGLNTDDDCDARSKETRTFLYRHFIIIIVVNETSRRPSFVFMKVTLLHIKEENNNPRV